MDEGCGQPAIWPHRPVSAVLHYPLVLLQFLWVFDLRLPLHVPHRVLGSCDIPVQGLIGLIEYSCQQVATSFPEAGLQRTPRLNVLGPEKFGDV